MRRKKRKAPATSSSGMSNDEDDIDYTSKNSDTGLVTSSSSFADQSSSPRGDCRDGTANMHHTSSWSTSSRMNQQDQHRFASFKGRDNVHPEGRENSDAAAPGDRHQTINQMEESQPSMIRPSPKPILHRQHLPYQSISVDQLEGDQRDLYLRDFLPPDPSIRSNTMKSHFIYPAPTHQSMHETSGPPPPSSARDTAENDQFPVVKV